MSVVPLTLTISLCLVFTFVVFFLREHSRHRFSGAESESLLPLADETPHVLTASDAGMDSANGAALKPAHACKGNGSCASCKRRAEYRAALNTRQA
jgi:cbb3-type cytochrome oxidase subunit 3